MTGKLLPFRSPAGPRAELAVLEPVRAELERWVNAAPPGMVRAIISATLPPLSPGGASYTAVRLVEAPPGELAEHVRRLDYDPPPGHPWYPPPAL